MRNNIRKLLVVVIFIISMLAFTPKVLAINTTGNGIELASIQPAGSAPGNVFYNIGVRNENNNDLKPRKLGSLVYLAKDTDGVHHAYCIQPGIPIPYSGDTTDNKNYSLAIEKSYLVKYADDGEPARYWKHTYGNISLQDNSGAIATAISKVLNYTYEFPISATKIEDFITAVKNNMTWDEYQKVIAGQILVWELRTGERTPASLQTPKSSDSDYEPDNAQVIYNEAKNNGYKMIFNNSSFSTAKAEYKRILDAVYYSYYYLPGNSNGKFSFAETQAQTIEIDINKEYTIVDTKGAFEYFKAVNVPNGLSITNTGDSIKIVATKAISQSDAKTIELSLKTVKNDGIPVYYQCMGELTSERKGCQDLAYGGAPHNLYLKVHTNKYSLKVKKVDESGNPLAGAKFNICRDASCNTPINEAPLVTGTDGIAELTNLAELGDYYIKEVEAPSGYMISTAIKKVNLTADTTAPVEFTNTAKIVRLTKVTVDEKGNIVDLNDGCGTNAYTGPVFKLYNEGAEVSLIKIRDGEYEFAKTGTAGATTEIRTCNGKFSVRLLDKCDYKISEVEPPAGLTLPSNATQSLNACNGNSEVSFTNGFTGLEFQKKNEEGEFIDGGKYALQKKINNVYKDVLLLKKADGSYEYSSSLTDGDTNAAYIFTTKNGKALIAKIEPGEYRVVEKSAPDGYEAIEEKDSTAIVTISDANKDGYYLVQLINKKVNLSGDSSSAELVVTITTGRRILNYTLIFIGLALALVLLVLVRRKMKK